MLPAGRSRGVPGRLSAARFIPSPAVRMPMMQQVRPMHVAVETEKGKAWVESAALWNLKASACCTVLSCAVLHESVSIRVLPFSFLVTVLGNVVFPCVRKIFRLRLRLASGSLYVVLYCTWMCRMCAKYVLFMPLRSLLPEGFF